MKSALILSLMQIKYEFSKHNFHRCRTTIGSVGSAC